MAVLTFRCPACGNAFQAPSERIPPAGARGKCKQCGAAVVIYPDGRTLRAQEPGAEPQAPPPQKVPDDPVWEVRPQNPNAPVARGPHTILDIRRMIVEGQIFEDDQARVYQGPWMPLTAYPVLNSFWAERAERQRELYGDEDHCALHRERKPGWRCPKCHNYLCSECVINRPIIEGGAARYLCLSCEIEATPVKRESGLKKLIPGAFKK
jgi:predicted Zn finger-like uncharacterized protein